MQHLSSQPNVVELNTTFEDQQNIHLIMELCSGGMLSYRITLKGSYPERAAAAIGRAIVNVVCACHFMGAMHRDLKLESFLFSTRDEDALLKVTGFTSGTLSVHRGRLSVLINLNLLHTF